MLEERSDGLVTPDAAFLHSVELRARNAREMLRLFDTMDALVVYHRGVREARRAL